MDKSPPEWMIEPLRKYAVFTGRARRAEYWWFALFAFLVQVFALFIDFGLGHPFGPIGVIRSMTSLALIIPQFAVGFRRLHDIDRSGWWLFAPMFLMIPISVGLFAWAAAGGSPRTGTSVVLGIVALILCAYAIVLLIWACTQGTTGPNRFGPDPLVTPPTD